MYLLAIPTVDAIELEWINVSLGIIWVYGLHKLSQFPNSPANWHAKSMMEIAIVFSWEEVPIFAYDQLFQQVFNANA